MTARFLLLLSCCWLSSCGLEEEVNCVAVQCSPCPPALSVRLHVPQGQPAPEATVEGAEGFCSIQPSSGTVCTLAEDRSGSFEFDIKAPGYQTAHVSESVKAVARHGCCSCGYDSRLVEVSLTPL